MRGWKTEDMLTLIIQEWKKIIRVRAIPLMMFGAVLLSLAIFFFQVFLRDVYAPADYRSFFESVDKTRPEEELLRLKAVYQDMLYGTGVPESLVTGSIPKEMSLYRQAVLELEQVAGYPSYLSGIRKNAERKLKSTLLVQQKTSLRELEKVLKDFSGMEETKAEWVLSRGIVLFMETGLPDFFLVILIFLISAGMVSAETEEGAIRLLRCTKRGRKQVVYAKYLAGGELLLLLQAAIWGSRLLIAVLAYGTSCFPASIVSLYGASGCTLNITIGQGVLLFFLLKFLAYMALYSLVFLLALAFRQPWKTYAFAGAPIAFFWVLYTVIEKTSYLAVFKWFNPAAFLYTDTLLLEYRNILLFGCPVTYRHIMVSVCLLSAAACLLLYGRIFLKVAPEAPSGKKTTLFYAVETVIAYLTGRHSSAGYEFRKWMFYQSGAVVCALFAVGMFFLYSPVAEQLHTEEEIYYRHYVKEAEGEFSEEKLEHLYQEQDYLDGIKEKLMSGKPLDPNIASYYQKELKKEMGLKEATAYGEYIKEKGSGSFVYEQGYERLFGKRDTLQLFLYRCSSLAAVVFLSVLIYGIEHRTGMEKLIQISSMGRQRIVRYKLCNTLYASIFVFCIAYIPWFCNVFSVYGMEGLAAPAFSLWRMPQFQDVSPNVTVGMLLIAYYGMHLLYLYASGLFAGFVAKKLKSPLLASLAAFGMTAIPVLIWGR